MVTTPTARRGSARSSTTRGRKKSWSTPSDCSRSTSTASEWCGRQPDRSLKKIAEETGGGYFELKKTDELAPTFTRVAQELHSLYTIGFSPSVLDGKEHKLDVKMRQTSMTARARKTYIASAERLSNTN